MPWTLDRAGTRVRLTLGARVGIEEAREFHAELVGLAAAAQPVAVDATGCDDLDCAALQLLVAFAHACDGQGRPATFDAGAGTAAARLQHAHLA